MTSASTNLPEAFEVAPSKAISNFSRYSGPKLTPVAETIQLKLTANLTTFTSLPVSPGELLDLIGTFTEFLAKKVSRDKDDVSPATSPATPSKTRLAATATASIPLPTATRPSSR